MSATPTHNAPIPPLLANPGTAATASPAPTATETLASNTLTDWGIAAGIAGTIILLVMLLKPILIRRLQAFAAHTHTKIDDAAVRLLGATSLWLVAVVAIDAGSQAVNVPPRLSATLAGAATLAVFLQIGLWLNVLLAFWIERSYSHAIATNTGAATSLSALGFLGRVVLWAVMVLLALDNLGVNISTLIAGLGIGGIAVALAVQNVLGDLFASLSIVIDKPFVIGDFIIVDSMLGTVEHVGLKTTRLRSLDGEQIVMSNSDLLKGRIRNYKRMYERRVAFKFSVAPDTTPDQLEKIPPIVRRLVESQKKVRIERAHFARIGDSAHEFETIYWVTDPDYSLFMDIQQALNLALLREMDALGVQFSFAAKTVMVEGPVDLRIEGSLPAGPGPVSGRG